MNSPEPPKAKLRADSPEIKLRLDETESWADASKPPDAPAGATQPLERKIGPKANSNSEANSPAPAISIEDQKWCLIEAVERFLGVTIGLGLILLLVLMLVPLCSVPLTPVRTVLLALFALLVIVACLATMLLAVPAVTPLLLWMGEIGKAAEFERALTGLRSAIPIPFIFQGIRSGDLLHYIGAYEEADQVYQTALSRQFLFEYQASLDANVFAEWLCSRGQQSLAEYWLEAFESGRTARKKMQVACLIVGALIIPTVMAAGYVTRGMIMLSSGKYAEGRQFLQICVAPFKSIFPGHAELLVFDSTDLCAGNYENAEAILQDCLHKFKLQNSASALIQQHKALFVLSYVQMKQNNFEAARKTLKEADELQSKRPIATNDGYYSLVKGYLAEHDGDYARAEALFNQSVSNWPASPYRAGLSRATAHGALANLYRQQKRYLLSETLFKQAMEMVPVSAARNIEDALIRDQYALMLKECGRAQEAESLERQSSLIKQLLQTPL